MVFYCMGRFLKCLITVGFRNVQVARTELSLNWIILFYIFCFVPIVYHTNLRHGISKEFKLTWHSFNVISNLIIFKMQLMSLWIGEFSIYFKQKR
jgi:hypothetical protein